MIFRYLTPTCLGLLFVSSLSIEIFAQAEDRFFDRDGLVLIARDPQPAAGETGIVEDPVPIQHVDQGGAPILLGDFQVIDIADEVPGVPDPNPPLTVVDLVSNAFIRLTPQNADGTTNRLGTSVNRSPSFRTPDEVLQDVPENIQAKVITDTGGDRYRSQIQSEFPANGLTLATVNIDTTFPDPPIGMTSVDVSSEIRFLTDVALANAPGFHPENDRLRMATFSSSFIGTLPDGFELPDGLLLPDGSDQLPDGATSFDTNIIRFEDANGIVHSITLTDATPKNSFLFGTTAVPLGNWVELVKSENDTINPGSPSVRLDITGRSDGLTLGLQGFLFDADAIFDPGDPEYVPDPRQDSLQVWLEVLDTDQTVLADTTYSLDYRLSATAVPEPMSFVVWSILLCVGGGVIGWKKCSRRSFPSIKL